MESDVLSIRGLSAPVSPMYKAYSDGSSLKANLLYFEAFVEALNEWRFLHITYLQESLCKEREI